MDSTRFCYTEGQAVEGIEGWTLPDSVIHTEGQAVLGIEGWTLTDSVIQRDRL